MDSFPKFSLNYSKLSVLTENCDTWYLGGADSKSRVRFLKLQPKIYFSANLDRKSQSYLFFLKIGTYGISIMPILIPTLVFWISKAKSIFEKIWARNVKVVPFGWKVLHRASRGCWFLFTHYFSQFLSLNPFWVNLCQKNLNWLRVLIMSRTRFRVNLHSIAAWMLRNSLIDIWNLGDCNRIWTQNHLVHKRKRTIKLNWIKR